MHNFFVFSYCSCDHRHLPSFPTRRSSDLAKMRWDVPDAVPSDRLNRILWHSIRGWNTPYPGTKQAVFSPLSLRSEEHTSELQSLRHLVCRLLLEKKKNTHKIYIKFFYIII